MSDVERLEPRLAARVGRAIGDFELIEPGDRILVGVSGGRDSWALFHLLRLLQRKAPIPFELLALNVDQGFAGFRADLVARVDLRALPIPTRPGVRVGDPLPLLGALVRAGAPAREPVPSG